MSVFLPLPFRVYCTHLQICYDHTVHQLVDEFSIGLAGVHNFSTREGDLFVAALVEGYVAWTSVVCAFVRLGTGSSRFVAVDTPIREVNGSFRVGRSPLN